MKETGPAVLYVVYWGAMEPLGRSLVLPPVRLLAARGVRLGLVTFEKPDDWNQRDATLALRQELGALGISWEPLKYHKGPGVIAKVRDVWAGWRAGLRLHRQRPFDIVHARTFVGEIMGLFIAFFLRRPLVLHNEGFYPDEQVDGGVWSRTSLRYRVARIVEKVLYSRASAIIVLSRPAAATLKEHSDVARRGTPVVVAPSCVDLSRFAAPRAAQPRDWANGIRFVYMGSVGARYDLAAVARFVAIAREAYPGTTLQVLSLAQPAFVLELMAAGGLNRDAWTHCSVAHQAIPRALEGCDVGLHFLRPGPSSAGGSPTKIGEYWAAGLAVVVTANMGDAAEIAARERVGVVVEEHSQGGYRKAAEELRDLLHDPGLTERCRRAAEQHYALDTACGRQLALYQQVIEAARSRTNLSVGPSR